MSWGPKDLPHTQPTPEVGVFVVREIATRDVYTTNTYAVVDTRTDTTLFRRVNPVEAIALADGLRRGIVQPPEKETSTNL